MLCRTEQPQPSQCPNSRTLWIFVLEANIGQPVRPLYVRQSHQPAHRTHCQSMVDLVTVCSGLSSAWRGRTGRPASTWRRWLVQRLFDVDIIRRSPRGRHCPKWWDTPTNRRLRDFAFLKGNSHWESIDSMELSRSLTQMGMQWYLLHMMILPLTMLQILCQIVDAFSHMRETVSAQLPYLLFG